MVGINSCLPRLRGGSRMKSSEWQIVIEYEHVG